MGNKFKKLMASIKNNEYRKRLFLIMILVAIIPMIGVSIANMKVVSTQISERDHNEVENNVNKIVYNINNLFTSVESLSNSVYLNPEISAVLNTPELQDVGHAYVEVIYPIIRQATSLNNYITDMSIMIDKESEFIANGKEVVRLSNEERQKSYYKVLFNDNGVGEYWEKTKAIDGINLLVFYKKLDKYSFTNEGVLRIEISERFIYENYIGTQTNHLYYICDGNNNVISTNDRENIGEILPKELLDYKNFDNEVDGLVFRKITNTVNPNCYVVVKLLDGVTSKEIARWNAIYLGSSVIILLIIISLSLLLLKKDVSKIDHIAHSLSKVVDGDYSGKVDFSGHDELSKLGQDYDKMLDYLNFLIKETYEKNLQIAKYDTAQKQTELTALQKQIHPHFLYNTLDAIRMLTVLQDNRAVEDSLVALANYFKYNVGFGNDEVSIKNEIENVMNFVDLINIRRDIPIKIVNEVSDVGVTQKIIRFILQPLIENSIKHGFNRESQGIIKLQSACEDDLFILTMKNNGSQIEKEKLKMINQRLIKGDISKTNENVGLLNVNKRIKLKYGNEYGIALFNNKDGVTVFVRLPLSKEI